MGFLLGSCGVGLALTSEICLKGLPKTPTGEILQFKGQQASSVLNVLNTCFVKKKTKKQPLSNSTLMSKTLGCCKQNLNAMFCKFHKLLLYIRSRTWKTDQMF